MVLNESSHSIFLRKSASSPGPEDYHFCGKRLFSKPKIYALKANKTCPTYYVVYEGMEGDTRLLYGKITGPDKEKAEEILKKVPTVSKSVFLYTNPKTKVTHYKIVATNMAPHLIWEKEQRQLNIIKIFFTTLAISGFVMSLPIFLLTFFFAEGKFALVILLVYLWTRIQTKVPGKKITTMASYDL